MTKHEKIKELRREQESLMYKDSKVKNSIYIPKMAFTQRGMETSMLFFESELLIEQDIYTECVSRDYKPEDKERTLYKYIHNPFFREEYQEKITSNGNKAYLIPLSELLNISKTYKKKDNSGEIKSMFKLADKKSKETTPPTSLEESFNDMTIKDYCAIHWKKPVSDKEWLNNFIRETFNLK